MTRAKARVQFKAPESYPVFSVLCQNKIQGFFKYFQNLVLEKLVKNDGPKHC